MTWKPINMRRMKGKGISESKDAFYDQLQAELENTPPHEMQIVMGDLEPWERKVVAS